MLPPIDLSSKLSRIWIYTAVITYKSSKINPEFHLGYWIQSRQLNWPLLDPLLTLFMFLIHLQSGVYDGPSNGDSTRLIGKNIPLQSIGIFFSESCTPLVHIIIETILPISKNSEYLNIQYICWILQSVQLWWLYSFETYMILAEVEFRHDGHAAQRHDAAWLVIQHASPAIPHILKIFFFAKHILYKIIA